jgi:hypothetical protein
MFEPHINSVVILCRQVFAMKRSKYKGSQTETVSFAINFPFTIENLRTVLAHGANPDKSPYSHHDIANWYERFWNEYCDSDLPSDIEHVMPILADVETQWDLYLANTYSLEQLWLLSLSEVFLPKEWFDRWLSAINT